MATLAIHKRLRRSIKIQAVKPGTQGGMSVKPDQDNKLGGVIYQLKKQNEHKSIRKTEQI